MKFADMKKSYSFELLFTDGDTLYRNLLTAHNFSQAEAQNSIEQWCYEQVEKYDGLRFIGVNFKGACF